MKTYPKMKETSIPWLGKIPEHWEVRKIKHFYQRKVEKNLPDGEVLSLYRDLGIVIKSSREDNFNRTSEDTSNYNVVAVYDLVINKMKAWQGSVAVSEHHGIVSPAYYVCRPISNNVYWQYAHHLLRAAVYHPEYRRLSEGIRLGQWDLSYDDWKNIPFLLPSLPEQQTIAAYLDKATAKIDALIAEQEKLCTLLAEKRKALISHVVTKGLDPKAKLKSSGISWLGDIPEHWEAKPLKHIVSIPITDGPHETPELYDDGVPFLSAEAISNGVLDFEKKRGNISKEDYVKFSLKYIPKVYDIFMIKSGATTGVTAIVETDTIFTIWSPLAVIRADKEKAFPYYILAALRSDNFQKAVALNWNFGTQQNIGMKVLENIRIPIPPLLEQHAIAAYLDKATAKLDALAAKAEEGIALLKERRSALISEVVTGKVRVA